MATSALIEAPQIPERVIERYARDKKLHLKKAREHMKELSKFLIVCGTFPGENAPSRALDDPWHTFVLFTGDYCAFCNQAFGRFIHHQPTGTQMNDAYQKTRRRAQELFGELDPHFWPQTAGAAAICNDCCESNPGGGHPQG